MSKSEKIPTDYKADRGELKKSTDGWLSSQSVVGPHEARIAQK